MDKETSPLTVEKTAFPHHIDSFNLPQKSTPVTGNGARVQLLFPQGDPTGGGCLSGTGRTGIDMDLRPRDVHAELGVRMTDNPT